MVDVVIPYVNPNDKNWLTLYNKYRNESHEPFKEKRFRDTSFLKYVLRSIDKYMEFVDKVFLVVQSESQVPKWVNRETVRVVLHEEFIPKEYLPTFNCNTIEMFLHKIPNLSEYFIYFNDDTLINCEMSEKDFFHEGKCNIVSKKCETKVGGGSWHNCLVNNTVVVNEVLNIKEDNNVWHVFPHTVTPLYKPSCEELYDLIKSEIHNSITRFRSLCNFNQHIYAYYIERKSIISNKSISVDYINLNRYNYLFLKNAKSQTICINDLVLKGYDEIIGKHKKASKDLEKKYNFISKYEKRE